MHTSVTAVQYEDTFTRSVRLILIRPGTLTAFQHHGIIVDMHKTAVDENIRTHIDIDGIR